ncbi:hypothetical protein [Listeria cornellensis]|uniref:Uncharacterized protein n=1 Tax=Listeria cornellensis FSL F6-0969 TaxID=1265820 RepID=W7BVK9_9LIST|nr:hypothetical protein [Listeria cornellensis]EUJ30789.1 hypothetical protein PCORN_07170 [Listeria cornellensis FSL F6-0969]
MFETLIQMALGPEYVSLYVTFFHDDGCVQILARLSDGEAHDGIAFEASVHHATSCYALEACRNTSISLYYCMARPSNNAFFKYR